MITSHTIDELFKPSGAADTIQARAVWQAAATYARTMTDLAPQSPALESALRYVQISALLTVHSIDTTV